MIRLIKLKLSIQQNIMKEYQYLINTLLLIIGEKNEEEIFILIFELPFKKV